MLTYIALALLLLVLLVLALAMRKPDDFTIEREGSIPAPPEAVFAMLQDFQQWARFSPWEALDPNMTRSFSGAAQGVGAAYAWVGNKKVGRGDMLITAVEPARSVAIDLNFEAPMKARNTTLFTMRPDESGTHLIWSMSGKNNLVGKLFSLVFNIDKMVGTDFERGLNNLRTQFSK